MTMIDDGVKSKGKEEEVEILDLAELLIDASIKRVNLDWQHIYPGSGAHLGASGLPHWRLPSPFSRLPSDRNLPYEPTPRRSLFH